MASAVGIDDAPQRRSHFRSISIWSVSFAFSGLDAGASSQAAMRLGMDLSKPGRYVSNAAARRPSMEKSFLFCRTMTAWRPRADSLPLSTYFGKSLCFGLLGPAAAQGQSFEL